MKCFTCKKLTDDPKKDKVICASCRKVLKIDLVRAVLKLDRVYLSETTRNKTGRKPKLTATQEKDIKCAYENGKISMENLAKEYNICAKTVSRTIHRQLSPPGMPRA